MTSSRRDFLKSLAAGTSAALIPDLLSNCASDHQRPNILWITSEDNSPLLGCYGDEFATTPHLDRFAGEGILYTNAFATTPVCAPARCTIITGVHTPSLGTQHMRSRYPIPDSIEPFPLYLRKTGYYCTNNSKTDYNFLGNDSSYWDESSPEAHYKNRRNDQPFFAVFNITVSHESSIHKSIPTDELRHKPEDLPFIPPYHPDTEAIRHDWAQYYDKVEDMDSRVGEILRELEESGLSEDTIVFYYSDHGGVLPRSKRFLYDTGLRVPCIIRFPPKFRHLAPEVPGSRTDRIITFVDLPATVLSLAGVSIPDYMQGKAFLGDQECEPRDYAQSYRGRMDERFDFSRSLRDKRFRYTRNFNPHRPYAQYIQYLWRAPATRSWEKEYRAQRCDNVQSSFWEPKPTEELYDILNDPWEVNNLAADPGHKDVLERMRGDLKSWQMEIHDSGFLPEGTLSEISKEGTIYEFVRSEAYAINNALETAWMATDNENSHLEELRRRMTDRNPLIRYWAAMGFLINRESGLTAESGAALLSLLNDQNGDVAVVASEAVINLGYTKEGLSALSRLLDHPNSKVVLRTLNTLDQVGPLAKPILESVRTISEHEDDYVRRAAARLLELLS